MATDPAYASALEEMSGRLDRWMVETTDPLLDGPVEAPPGAEINLPEQVSPQPPPIEPRTPRAMTRPKARPRSRWRYRAVPASRRAAD